MFDFEKFAEITASVFPGGQYSLKEVLYVFGCYFERYEKYMGHPHPPIKASQIVRIIQAMPYFYPGYHVCDRAEIWPSDYPVLIDKHFQTRYRRCDYNINHFFSGQIRELRYFEELY